MLFNGVLFAVGKHSGNNLVDSHLLCDGVGGFLIVACEHNGFKSHFLKLGNCLDAVVPNDVGNGYYSDHLAVLREDHGRFARFCKLACFLRYFFGNFGGFGDICGVSSP